MDITIQKILEKLKEKNEMDINEFRRELSFVRLNKTDTKKIIAYLKRKNIIALKKDKTLKIVFRNFCFLVSLVFVYIAYLIMVVLWT